MIHSEGSGLRSIASVTGTKLSIGWAVLVLPEITPGTGAGSPAVLTSLNSAAAAALLASGGAGAAGAATTPGIGRMLPGVKGAGAGAVCAKAAPAASSATQETRTNLRNCLIDPS